MDFNNIKFRCSGLGSLMTEPRSKSETISETTKKALIEKYIFLKYGRDKELFNKYVEKGLLVEEDSLTLFARVKKEMFRKNEVQLSNDFLTGTPDLFIGPEIENAEIIIDLKSSWDIFTFWSSKTEALNKNYYWQLQGYMALTGAKGAKLVYCLIDTPNVLINDELRRLQWKMGVSEPSDKLFVEAANEKQKEMVFSDIPITERIHEIDIPRNDSDIEKLYQRINDCRKWMEENL